MNDTTGRRIAWLRELRGFSQGDLAEKIGRSRGYVGQLETDRSMPSVEVLVALADALETSTDFLLLRTDDPGEGRRYPFAASEDERWARIETLVERLDTVADRFERLEPSGSGKVIDPVALVIKLLARLTPEERDLLLKTAGVISETVEEAKATGTE